MMERDFMVRVTRVHLPNGHTIDLPAPAYFPLPRHETVIDESDFAEVELGNLVPWDSDLDHI
jgi:hypothetical protein